MKRSTILHSAVILLALAGQGFAASFTITNGQTLSSQQTLSSAGQTGTVNAGGSLSLGGSTVAVLMSSTTTLTNNGTIQQTGSGRVIDNTIANSSLTVENAGTISSVSTDAIRVNSDSAISLTNSGTISVSNGGQAIDWAAIATKSNSLTNGATGVITTVGEDAVRPGVNGVVNNAGTITATPTGGATPTGSDGIDLRTLTGISITNTGSISGRSGIATDGANAGPSTLTVNNNAGTISGVNGSGINVDGVSTTVQVSVTNALGATVRGGVLAAATNGDGDGIDVDGVLTLNNSGDVLGYGAKGVGSDGQANNVEGIAAGGGTITNTATGRIIGSTLTPDAPNGDSTREGHGILVDDSSGGGAVAATMVTNSGLIQGRTGYGIRILGTFADTITNNAGGTIRGAGTGAAIQTGGGNDTVTNRGTIIGDNGSAIDLEAGNDSLVIEGAAASVTGDISGGAGTNTATFDPGTGNSFGYSGTLSNFATVQVKSGVVTLSGSNSYAGETKVTGGTLVLDGANRLASSGLLTLDGGTIRFASIDAANGQTFAALSLTATSTIDLNHTTSLTLGGFGSYIGGASLAIIGYDASLSPGYAVRFAGDLTTDAGFLALKNALTINGLTPRVTVTGGYTTMTPVPEPSTIYVAVLLTGLIAWRVRRLAAARV